MVVVTCFAIWCYPMILQQISGDFQNVQKGQWDLKSPRCWWEGNCGYLRVILTQHEQAESPYGPRMVAGRI